MNNGNFDFDAIEELLQQVVRQQSANDADALATAPQPAASQPGQYVVAAATSSNLSAQHMSAAESQRESSGNNVRQHRGIPVAQSSMTHPQPFSGSTQHSVPHAPNAPGNASIDTTRLMNFAQQQTSAATAGAPQPQLGWNLPHASAPTVTHTSIPPAGIQQLNRSTGYLGQPAVAARDAQLPFPTQAAPNPTAIGNTPGNLDPALLNMALASILTLGINFQQSTRSTPNSPDNPTYQLLHALAAAAGYGLVQHPSPNDPFDPLPQGTTAYQTNIGPAGVAAAAPYGAAAPNVFDPGLPDASGHATAAVAAPFAFNPGVPPPPAGGAAGLLKPPPPDSPASKKIGVTRKRNSCPEPFAQRLYRLLEEVEAAGKTHIISWTPSEVAFRIHDTEAFMKEVAPHYFHHKKIASLKRQLSHYMFELVFDGADVGGFRHPCFRKGRYDLLNRVRREK